MFINLVCPAVFAFGVICSTLEITPSQDLHSLHPVEEETVPVYGEYTFSFSFQFFSKSTPNIENNANSFKSNTNTADYINEESLIGSKTANKMETQCERTMTSPLVGTYEGIEVRNSNVLFNGRSIPISWINLYTFYFKLSNRNEQIWTFDISKNVLYQFTNQIPWDVFQKNHTKHSSIQGTAYCFQQKIKKNLGTYEDANKRTNKLDSTFIVTENEFIYCKATRHVKWINPLVFYFKWLEGNEQFWIYDSTVPGYLQLGQWGKSISDAISHDVERAHKQIF